jgi:hypothetical protein
MTLVFCSHRGVSLACKHCEHALAHRIGKISFSGPFTCDGGQKCTAPIAEETKGIFGSPEVWGGEKQVGEVKCVPVENKSTGLLGKARTAILGLLRENQTWSEKKCSQQHAQAVANQIEEHLKGNA